MNLLRKNDFFSGAVVTATLLFALTALSAPRSALALGDEPVRVANTAAGPAIVEEVPHFASHLVTLYAFSGLSGAFSTAFQQVGTDGGNANTVYVVPPGQSFVITGVDINPNDYTATSSLVSVFAGAGGLYGSWMVPGTVSTEFQYPSGVVVRSGTSLYLVAGPAFGVFLHGYLTAN
jgi:hypothetical protein